MLLLLSGSGSLGWPLMQSVCHAGCGDEYQRTSRKPHDDSEALDQEMEKG